MPSYTSQQYAARDQIVLALAAHHRVLLPRCAANAVSAGKPLTHALNRLTDDGQLVRHERLLPGGLTAYTVSATAALRLGLPRERAELPTGAALDLAIAVQAFCFLGREPRYRLTAKEAASLFGAAAPSNVPFVLSNELSVPAVLRIVLATNRAPAEAIRHLRTLIEQGERHASLGAWISSRQLGFALLAPTLTHAAGLTRALQRSRLAERFAVVVDAGPDAEHLAAFLKAAKGN